MRFFFVYKSFVILFLIAILISSCSLFRNEKVVLKECGGFPEPVIPESKLEVLAFLPWNLTESIKPPEIIGGIDSLIKTIQYPEIAKRVSVSGAVLCEFIINSEGKPKSVKLIKGIGAGCDEALLDAIKYLRYIPAKKNGKNIDQIMRVSVKFILLKNKP